MSNLPELTMNDLNKYVKRKLLIIDGFVCDVSEFIGEHPGGNEIIEENINKDATEAYNNIKHSKYANQVMTSLRIGKFKIETKKQTSDLPELTMNDLNKYVGRKLLIIDGFVCDVTDFIEEHPGGDEIIQENINKDATKAYKDIKHSEHANQIMTSLRIGKFKIEKADDPIFTNANPQPKKSSFLNAKILTGSVIILGCACMCYAFVGNYFYFF